MKVVAYSVDPIEKEFLAKANQKKHDITLISNALNLATSVYAEGKDAVLVFTNDDLSAPVIEKLAGLGIRYISTRSFDTNHMDKNAAGKHSIKLSNIPGYLLLDQNKESMQNNADQIIRNLDLWQLNKCVGKACACAKGCQTVSS